MPAATGTPAGPARRPTICVFTPYYPRFKLAPSAGATEPSPNIFKYRDMFVPRGYALLAVARALFPGLVRHLLSSKGAALATPQSGGDASKGADGAVGIGATPLANPSRIKVSP